MNLNEIINNLIDNLTSRQKEILEGRFGLQTGQKMTLAALGEKYGLTRERVRQIEEEALKLIAKKIKSGPTAKILAAAANELKKIGNARREDFLVEDIRKLLKDKDLTAWQIRFLFEAAGHPRYYLEDKNFHSFWYKDKAIFKKV
ncbi:MAG: sigma factor-like helix-turn-helix DNA-binding protein, partial [Candidatus Paceibacterota bacterium]